jgi:hypothetical protein
MGSFNLTPKTWIVSALMLFFFYSETSWAQESDNTAFLTVIRHADRKSKIQKPKLFINGKKKCIIPDAGYTTFTLNQGEHTVFAAFNKLVKSGEEIRETSLSINAEPRQHYYVLMVITDIKRKIVSVTPIMESGAARLMKDYSKCDCSNP